MADIKVCDSNKKKTLEKKRETLSFGVCLFFFLKKKLMRQFCETKVRTFIAKQIQKGIVLNEQNVEDYVDAFIEVKEREANKEIITETELEQVVDEIIVELIAKNLIYKRSDWRSYSECVRDKQLISLAEFDFMEKLQGTTDDVEFRDTEFPLDQNGRYLEPHAPVQESYCTKIRGKPKNFLILAKVLKAQK